MNRKGWKLKTEWEREVRHFSVGKNFGSHICRRRLLLRMRTTQRHFSRATGTSIAACEVCPGAEENLLLFSHALKSKAEVDALHLMQLAGGKEG